MKILAGPPSTRVQVSREPHAPELDALMSAWLAPDADDGDDGLETELVGAMGGPTARGERGSPESDPGGRRLAQGTGQFDLRSPEMVQAVAGAPLSCIMTRKVVCARPEMDASEARARMVERNVSGLPVVDHWGRAVGLISKSDLVEHQICEERAGVAVADIMMPFVFALGPDASIGRAAALMAYEGIHRVVVVDRAGYLVGLVSALDVARWLGGSTGHPVGRDAD